MLNATHRVGGLAPAADKTLPPKRILAALTPLAILLCSPLAANAQEAPRNFGGTELTDGNDTVTNDKTVDLVGDVNFGDGSDALTNNGVITIGANATAPVRVTLLSLDALKNTGLIDMRNGRVGDVLTLPDDYTASGQGRLGLDVSATGSDQLVVGDIANGKTAIVLSGLTAQTAVLTGDKGPILVKAGVGSAKDAFSIENSEIGFIRYSVVFDPAVATYRLKGQAGQRAFEALKISEGVGAAWRQTADAWSAHAASLRDGGEDTNGAGLWGQVLGQRMDRDDDIAQGDRKVSVDYRQTSYGGQMGVDLINVGLGEDHVVAGLTAGYLDTKMRFSGLAGQDVKLGVANFGGYLALSRSGYFLNALAKVDRQSIKAQANLDGLAAKFDGTSYGGQIEAGARSGDDGLAYEKLLSIAYVSTRLDDMLVAGQRLDFDTAAGFVAKAGVRGTARNDLLGGLLTTYGAAFVAHDLTIKNRLDFVSGEQTEHLSRDGGRTYGQVLAGVSFRAASGAIAFLEAGGDYGGGREGGSLRLGARFGF